MFARKALTISWVGGMAPESGEGKKKHNLMHD